MPKKPVKKKPKVTIKKVKNGNDNAITAKQLQKIANKSAYLQHKARLADFEYKQKLVKEFKNSHEQYIG